MVYDQSNRYTNNTSSIDYEGSKWDQDDRCGKDNKKQEHKDECNYYKHPLPKKVLLECGCNPQDAIFEIDDDEVEDDQCFTLDTVEIDTTCLYKPQVKIEFSSLVYFEAETDDDEIEVELRFDLVRECNGHEETVQSWKYLKAFEVGENGELEVEISEPFTVTFCDRCACQGCCKYKMKVRGIDFDGEFEALRVVKPDISAIAQGICGD